MENSTVYQTRAYHFPDFGVSSRSPIRRILQNTVVAVFGPNNHIRFTNA